MSVVHPEIRITPEELLMLPDSSRYELVDGKLVEREMGFHSSRVGGQVFGMILTYGEKNGYGWAMPADASYQCFADPSKVRRPDASFIRMGRLPGEQFPQGHCPIAPDLAVEVVSPNDNSADIEEKLAEYLEAGVSLVWVFYPRTRSVHVFRAQGHPERLTEEHLLTGEEVIPGFSCMVSECFPPTLPASSPA
jgi:Uma2 family endonuclease